MSVYEAGWPKLLVIYNTSTGEIRMTGGFESPADANAHTESGEAWIEGDANPRDYEVSNGQIQPKTLSAAEISAIDENTSRGIRDAMLTETDWTQNSDSPLTDAKKTEWATYRQSLRDLTSHANWPNLNTGDWPTKPS